MAAPKGNKNNLGKKWTIEQRKRHSVLKKGKPNGLLGFKHSEESKRKISDALMGNTYSKGIVWSKESRERLSKARKGEKKSEITKERMSLAQFREKHWNWRGGSTNDPYSIEWTNKLKKLIRERDKYICKICKIKALGTKLAVHHIDYNKQNCEFNNLISLCKSCHTKTNTNREKWLLFFKEKYGKYLQHS